MKRKMKPSEWRAYVNGLPGGSMCGPTGKVRYRSKGAAQEALAVIRGTGVHANGPRERRCYPCHYCGGYHLTSATLDLTRYEQATA